MSIGALLALLVLVSAVVLYLVGRMSGFDAGFFAGLAAAILLSPSPIAWKPGG